MTLICLIDQTLCLFRINIRRKYPFALKTFRIKVKLSPSHYLYVQIVFNFVHQLVCVENGYTFGGNLEINRTNATHEFDVMVMQLHLLLLLQQRRCCSHDIPVCSYIPFRIFCLCPSRCFLRFVKCFTRVSLNPLMLEL